MEIGRWLYYVVVSCILVCCSIEGKPFSLNKIIEAESHQREIEHTTVSPILEESEPTSERFSLNKGLKPSSRLTRKFKETSASTLGTTLNFIPLGKKISPLKYRKTFQIKSPLKPKRVKHSLRTRHKRKNQSVKTEIDGNAILNKKYIPLLRSLGMLFDNILGPDSGESIEDTKNKRKRFRYNPEVDKDSCKCPRQRKSNEDSESEEEAITFSEALATETSTTTEAATETADNTSTGNLRSFRQYKNVPLLFPRNTFGFGRNNHGLGERSSAAYNGSAERDISWDHGDSEHNTERAKSESSTESDEKHSNSASRNDASSVRARGRIPDKPPLRNKTEDNENDTPSEEEAEKYLDGSRGHIFEHNGPNKFKIGRDEAKSAEFLPQPVRGRGHLSEDKIFDTAESIQSKEDNEESDLRVAHDSSSDQRIFDRNGSSSTEDQKADARLETVIHQKSENKLQYGQTKSTKTSKAKGPVVVIIDGYSVTRHKNGENKLAEKAIHIHP